jgi:hypothetical protein
MRTTRTVAGTVAAIGAVIVLAAGCGSRPSPGTSPDPGRGTVVGKRSNPGHWESKKTCARKVAGKCRQWKTSQKWDDTDYELLVRSGDSEDWVEVGADTYESTQVGGRWPK